MMRIFESLVQTERRWMSRYAAQRPVARHDHELRSVTRPSLFLPRRPPPEFRDSRLKVSASSNALSSPNALSFNLDNGSSVTAVCCHCLPPSQIIVKFTSDCATMSVSAALSTLRMCGCCGGVHAAVRVRTSLTLHPCFYSSSPPLDRHILPSLPASYRRTYINPIHDDSHVYTFYGSTLHSYYGTLTFH